MNTCFSYLQCLSSEMHVLDCVCLPCSMRYRWSSPSNSHTSTQYQQFRLHDSYGTSCESKLYLELGGQGIVNLKMSEHASNGTHLTLYQPTIRITHKYISGIGRCFWIWSWEESLSTSSKFIHTKCRIFFFYQLWRTSSRSTLLTTSCMHWFIPPPLVLALSLSLTMFLAVCILSHFKIHCHLWQSLDITDVTKGLII